MGAGWVGAGWELQCLESRCCCCLCRCSSCGSEVSDEKVKEFESIHHLHVCLSAGTCLMFVYTGAGELFKKCHSDNSVCLC